MKATRGGGVPIRFWLWFAGLWFVPGLVFRVVIALGLEAESTADRTVAVLQGVVGDLFALFLVLGFLGGGFLLGARFARWWLGLVLAAAAIIFITDCFYWLEFQSRFDRFVLHYAEYPREVLVFLDDQFFVGLFVIPFAVLVWLVTRWAVRWLPTRITGRDRAVCCLWIVLGGLVFVYGSPGVAGHSRHLHHLGSNAYFGALMAARVDETVWDGFYWRPDPADPEVARLLAEAEAAAESVAEAEVERSDPDARMAHQAGIWSEAVETSFVGNTLDTPKPTTITGTGNVTKSSATTAKAAGPSNLAAGAPALPQLTGNETTPSRSGAGDGSARLLLASPESIRHVVLIIEESLGGEYWRNPEKRAQYMPRLMALAADGVAFESIYATGGFTIRGLEAILNGYPPLPGVVVTTEPRLERLPSLPRELGRAGFRTTFVYGGWPGFTSFHDYWRRIGYHEMLDRFDFDDRWFETSWGVADEILFGKVLEEMDRLTAAHDRVMLTTLTVSNHRPFDFPADRIDYPSDERRREYVVAYADWALGEFIDTAAQRPWFDDTLFVVAVDHGPVHEGPALVPAAGYRVPLVFYSPRNLQPAVFDQQGSIMSLAVTLLELLEIEPTNAFFGNSLFAGDGLAPVELHHEVGILGKDRMTVLVRGGGLLGWCYDGETLTPGEPDLAQAVEAEALFRAAHERLYGSP